MDSLEAFAGTCSEALARKAQEKRIPIAGTFELLPTCNMRCRMCYIQHTPDKSELQPVSFWVEAYRQAMAEGMLFSLLTGGEPLLYPWFHELYEALSELPVHICLNTNGTLLDRETAAMLAERPPRRVNVSLYGASDETYARLCGNPNGFTQVMHAFELLREYDIPFCVHNTMVPENACDEQAVIDLCDKMRVHLGRAYYIYPAYRKDAADAPVQERYTPQELAEVALRQARAQMRGDEQAYRKYVFQHTEAMARPQIYSAYGCRDVLCRGGRCTFWVDWRGQVGGCGIHNQMIWDLHGVPFAQAWQRIVQDTNALRTPEKCSVCGYRSICPVCPAASFCETGELGGVPDYLCRFSEAYGKLLLAERRRLFG